MKEKFVKIKRLLNSKDEESRNLGMSLVEELSLEFVLLLMYDTQVSIKNWRLLSPITYDAVSSVYNLDDYATYNRVLHGSDVMKILDLLNTNEDVLALFVELSFKKLIKAYTKFKSYEIEVKIIKK